MTSESARGGVRPGAGPACVLLMWAGLLVPPVVFLTDLLVSYSLAYWACSTGKRWVLDLVTLASLVLIAGCGGIAGRVFEASRRGGVAAGTGDAARFLGLVGLLSSLLFAIACLAFAVPRIVVGPCYP